MKILIRTDRTSIILEDSTTDVMQNKDLLIYAFQKIKELNKEQMNHEISMQNKRISPLPF